MQRFLVGGSILARTEDKVIVSGAISAFASSTFGACSTGAGAGSSGL